jgi:hypothetical protein
VESTDYALRFAHDVLAIGRGILVSVGIGG